MHRHISITICILSTAVFLFCSLTQAVPGVVRNKTASSPITCTAKEANLTSDGLIVLSVRDNLSGVDASSIRLVVDGVEVSPFLSPVPKGYRISYKPTSASSAYDVELSASDRARNSMRQLYRFVGPGNQVAVSGASDMNRPGPVLQTVRPDLETVRSRLQLADCALGSAGTELLPYAPRLDTVRDPEAWGANSERIFDVNIKRVIDSAEHEDICRVAFSVCPSEMATSDEELESYRLFIALAEPGGELVFYEHEAGKQGIPLEELTCTESGWRQLTLTFRLSGLESGNYTWYAAVAGGDEPESILSNLASSVLDASPPDCDVLSDASSFGSPDG